MGFLDIDKKQVKRRMWEMTKGGNQLIEVLDKVFSIEQIEQNKKKWRITNEELSHLKAWIKSNTEFEETVRLLSEEGIKSSSSRIKSILFFGGNGLLGKLYKQIALKPKFNNRGNLIKEFSFLEYTDVRIKGEEYRYVETKINMSKFSCDVSSQIDREVFEKKFVLKSDGKEWKVSNDDFAKEYLDGVITMEKLMGSI